MRVKFYILCHLWFSMVCLYSPASLAIVYRMSNSPSGITCIKTEEGKVCKEERKLPAANDVFSSNFKKAEKPLAVYPVGWGEPIIIPVEPELLPQCHQEILNNKMVRSLSLFDEESEVPSIRCAGFFDKDYWLCIKRLGSPWYKIAGVSYVEMDSERRNSNDQTDELATKYDRWLEGGHIKSSNSRRLD